MDQYTHNFLDKGFSTQRQILQLTEEDLEALGIFPVGHRKKIFKAIKSTKYQVLVLAYCEKGSFCSIYRVVTWKQLHQV